MADQVLHSGVRSITDLMVLPGLINLDFADVRTVMTEMGKAMMGTGEATGEDRALMAAQNAIQNPLLDEVSLKGAKAVLVNVTGGLDMTLLEVDEAANAISDQVDPEANIIFGAAFDPALEGKIRVSVVATGMDGARHAAVPSRAPPRADRRPTAASAPHARRVEPPRAPPSRSRTPSRCLRRRRCAGARPAAPSRRRSRAAAGPIGRSRSRDAGRARAAAACGASPSAPPSRPSTTARPRRRAAAAAPLEPRVLLRPDAAADRAAAAAAPAAGAAWSEPSRQRRGRGRARTRRCSRSAATAADRRKGGWLGLFGGRAASRRAAAAGAADLPPDHRGPGLARRRGDGGRAGRRSPSRWKRPTTWTSRPSCAGWPTRPQPPVRR